MLRVCQLKVPYMQGNDWDAKSTTPRVAAISGTQQEHIRRPLELTKALHLKSADWTFLSIDLKEQGAWPVQEKELVVIGDFPTINREAPRKRYHWRVLPQGMKTAQSSASGFELQEEKVQRMPPWKYLGLEIGKRTIVPQKLAIKTKWKDIPKKDRDGKDPLSIIEWVFLSHQRSKRMTRPQELVAELIRKARFRIRELAGWEKAGDVIKHLIHAFSFLGIPKELKTDNGPAYKSRELCSFLQQWGVEHKTGIPHSPTGLNPPIIRHFGASSLFSIRERPPVMVRDPESRRTEGPHDLVTWGRGYARVSTPTGPRWIPSKWVKPYVPKGSGSKTVISPQKKKSKSKSVRIVTDEDVAGPSHPAEETEPEIITRSLSLGELRDLRREFIHQTNESILTWLLRIWDAAANDTILDGNLDAAVVIPADLKQLFSCLLDSTEFKLWVAAWRQQLREALPSLLRDPETAVDDNGNPLTLEHLMGEGRWADPSDQTSDIPIKALQIAREHAVSAFFGMVPDGPVVPYYKIVQGTKESFTKFVERLTRAIEVQVTEVAPILVTSSRHEPYRLRFTEALYLRTADWTFLSINTKEQGAWPVQGKELVIIGDCKYTPQEVEILPGVLVNNPGDLVLWLRCTHPPTFIPKGQVIAQIIPTRGPNNTPVACPVQAITEERPRVDYYKEPLLGRDLMSQWGVKIDIPDPSVEISAASIDERPTKKLNWLTNEPVWVEQWPLSKPKLKVLEELVKEQLAKGHIVETDSPWNSPVL
ncbi:hypothetical protein DUI87_02479 [Hirundo rustica rustica]|uniref:Uncharacterized protein n=1 Tax=Hirundo rustica rustica TaxID=333673 RepID=A0A3M0L7J4_HIRRU|nr:hypothetical protein DUI87_02479 [Hirundo rustica rustica]